MTFLRKNTVLVRLLAFLFVSHLCAPVVLAAQNPEQASGIVICTTTGLKFLNQDGSLSPAGDKQDRDDNGNGGNDCLLCRTVGLEDAIALPAAPPALVPPLSFSSSRFVIARQILTFAGFSDRFNARAPPVRLQF